MRRLLIVGGSDAGVMAALKARQLDAEIQVTMALTDRYPNFSICDLPFFVSREVEDWQALAHRTVDEIRRHRIELLVEHVATRIDPAATHVILRDRAGHERAEKYATSARPRTEASTESIYPPSIRYTRWRIVFASASGSTPAESIRPSSSAPDTSG